MPSEQNMEKACDLLTQFHFGTDDEIRDGRAPLIAQALDDAEADAVQPWIAELEQGIRDWSYEGEVAQNVRDAFLAFGAHLLGGEWYERMDAEARALLKERER